MKKFIPDSIKVTPLKNSQSEYISLHRTAVKFGCLLKMDETLKKSTKLDTSSSSLSEREKLALSFSSDENCHPLLTTALLDKKKIKIPVNRISENLASQDPLRENIIPKGVVKKNPMDVKEFQSGDFFVNQLVKKEKPLPFKFQFSTKDQLKGLTKNNTPNKNPDFVITYPQTIPPTEDQVKTNEQFSSFSEELGMQKVDNLSDYIRIYGLDNKITYSGFSVTSLTLNQSQLIQVVEGAIDGQKLSCTKSLAYVQSCLTDSQLSPTLKGVYKDAFESLSLVVNYYNKGQPDIGQLLLVEVLSSNFEIWNFLGITPDIFIPHKDLSKIMHPLVDQIKKELENEVQRLEGKGAVSKLYNDSDYQKELENLQQNPSNPTGELIALVSDTLYPN